MRDLTALALVTLAACGPQPEPATPEPPAWTLTIVSTPGAVATIQDGPLAGHAMGIPHDGVHVWRGIPQSGFTFCLDLEGYGRRCEGVTLTADVTVEAPLSRIEPPVVRVADPLVGPLRVCGRSYCDDTGPRTVFGASWFPALRVLRDDRAGFYAQLNRMAAAGWQFARVFHAVGGWDDFWQGMEVAPVAFQPWRRWDEPVDRRVEAWPDYDELLRELLGAFRARGLRVALTAGDLQVLFPEAGADPSREIAHLERVARIAAELGDTVVLFEVANEMWQNHALRWDAHDRCGPYIERLRAILPAALFACSEPEYGEDFDVPDRLWQWTAGADVATMHGTRAPWEAAIRRAFNLVYDAGGGWRFGHEWRLPWWQGEPTGPDGSHPEVFLPQQDPDVLWALYAMHLITGQASTYFNGPAVRHRGSDGFEWLDAAWGFAELPALYRAHVPRDIGQWPLVVHGNRADAPLTALEFASAGAENGPARLDQVADGREVAAVVSAGAGAWRIVARRPWRYQVIGPAGIEREGRLDAFEAIPELHAGLRARVIRGWLE